MFVLSARHRRNRLFGLVYDGFISYSHAADDLLAPRLQAGLQRFAKPWWKRRALRIFRDESSLSANPHLWSSITDALDGSSWFVLLLSPEAADSEWVNREVEYWLEHNDADRIIPVVTEGDFSWAESHVVSNAAPPALRAAFSAEPRWVDLRFARSEEALDLNNPTFSAAIADIASPIRGVPKDELESEEVRQHRRTTRTAWAAGIALLALAVVASGAAVVAVGKQSEAQSQTEIAENERDRAVAAEDAATAAAESEAEQRSIAEEQAEVARSRELLAWAQEASATDPELQLMLTVEAAELGELTRLAEANVHQSLADHRAVLTFEMPDEWKGWSAGGEISPDGQLLAISNWQHHVAVLSMETGEVLWDFAFPWADPTAEFSGCCNHFNPFFMNGGSELVVNPRIRPDARAGYGEDMPPELAEFDGLVVFDAATGAIKRVVKLDEPLFGFDGWGHTAHGTLTLGLTGVDDVRLELLDIDTGDRRVFAEGVPTLNVFDGAALSDDGRFVAWGWAGEPIHVVAVESGFEVILPNEGQQVRDISPDGSLLVTNDLGSEVWADVVWDVGAGEELVRIPIDGNSWGVWFDPTGEWIYRTANFSDSVQRFDARTGRPIDTLFAAPGGSFQASMSDDGRFLAVGTGSEMIRVFDLSPAGAGEGPMVSSCRWPGKVSTTESVAVVGGFCLVDNDFGNMTAFLFDPDQLTAIRRIDDLAGGFAVVSPDGTMVAAQERVARDRAGSMIVLDASDGSVIQTMDGLCAYNEDTPWDSSTLDLECPAGTPERLLWLNDVEFSPDGTRLAAIGQDYAGPNQPSNPSAVMVWDVDTGELLWAHRQGGRSSGLAYTSDGERLASGWLSEVMLHNAESGEILVREGEGQGASGHALHFGPGDAFLVGADFIGGGSAEITVFDPIDLSVVDIIDGRAEVRDLSLSPSGELLAAGGSDGSIRVWRLGTRELIHEFPVANDRLLMVHFLDENRILAAGWGDSELRVFLLDQEELLTLAGSKITRGFTDGECDKYALDPCPTSTAEVGR